MTIRKQVVLGTVEFILDPTSEVFGRPFFSPLRPAASWAILPCPERDLPLHSDVEAWVDHAAREGGLLHRMVGLFHRLRDLAQSSGRASFHGHRSSRQLDAEASASASANVHPAETIRPAADRPVARFIGCVYQPGPPFDAGDSRDHRVAFQFWQAPAHLGSTPPQRPP